jgi:hypothetical protein
MGRRKPKRLKTGEKPNGEVVKVIVRIKVESDNKEEEESLDDDDNEEEEGQAVQPVAQVERPAYVAPRPYVPPRPDYILMDYNKSMGDVVIPEIKVIRLMNRPCYMKLDPVHWGKNSMDRCPTYGVC